jgi:hypothetical protein
MAEPRSDGGAISRAAGVLFDDPIECLRELVTHASRAGATVVSVRVLDVDDRHFQVLVCDDGHRMHAEALRRLISLAASSRRRSPAALAVSLTLTTSTGALAWRAVARPLLHPDPIYISAVSPVPSRGTRVRVRYRKREALDAMAAGARERLADACRGLSLRVELYAPGEQVPELLGDA